MSEQIAVSINRDEQHSHHSGDEEALGAHDQKHEEGHKCNHDHGPDHKHHHHHEEGEHHHNHHDHKDGHKHEHKHDHDHENSPSPKLKKLQKKVEESNKALK
jgi:cobalt-zinc-cadmium efflux system protein